MRKSPKFAALKKIIGGYRSCLLAYSGGVDSTFLAYVVSQCLPSHQILAVTATSATYTPEELVIAKKLMRSWRIPHRVIRTDEFKNQRFLRNGPDRCLYCKQELFSRLKKIASQEKLAVVVEASTVSDLRDYRPGNRAKRRFAVHSPLQAAGFKKQDVRRWSKRLDLPTWDAPSQACLASRIPYGTALTPAILKKVLSAERFLRASGFRHVRLRHYGSLCRIEVPVDDFKRLLLKRRQIVDRLKDLGYNYVTLDLQGLRSGSLNEVLRKKRP